METGWLLVEELMEWLMEHVDGDWLVAGRELMEWLMEHVDGDWLVAGRGVDGVVDGDWLVTGRRV